MSKPCKLDQVITRQSRIYLQPAIRIKRRQPLHKRISVWWDRSYVSVFEGCGAAIVVVVFMAVLCVAYVGLARVLGWW
jgi:hypothetical protein